MRLFARAVSLPTDPDVPARIPAALVRQFVELAITYGVSPCQPPSQRHGPRTFPLLGPLLWTFVRRPSQLSLAVTLSIYGLHFRKVSRACRH